MVSIEEEHELLGWIKQGIHECFRTTRGARLFGRAYVRAINNSTLEVITYDQGEQITWKVRLERE